MSESKTKTDSFEDRLDNLSDIDLKSALETVYQKLDHRTAAFLNSCVHCGLCVDSCHYYLSSGELESHPAYKLNLISSVFKKHFTPSGKIVPMLGGANPLDREMVKCWIDSLFGRCTLCGRCSLNCSVGIDISRMIRLGRSALAAADLVPPELQSTVAMALETGNNMGIPRAEWVDTVEWLEEELQMETGDPKASIPIDKPDTKYIYTLNPREPKFFPLSLLATAKIFYAAGESWTMSGDHYDVTNYALFNGDDAVGAEISGRLLETAKRLQAQSLILGECGHGYNANRWEAPEWMATNYGLEVKSVLQLISEYISQGRIKLDPSKHPDPVTLHDPCNLVRLGGIIEDQRFILKNAVSNFVEMYPNREKNFCCGGGGAQLSMTRYAERRMKAGQVKADQIRKTGAKTVVAPCHNCIDQLSELNREYNLGIEVKSVSEIVADALVIEKAG